MIIVKIKVKNDHRSLTEDFECDNLCLDPGEEPLRSWISKVMDDFKDPVDDVIVKTSQSC